jgi:hypothetical protein
MIRPCCRPSRVLLPMLIASLLTMLARPLAAQEVDRPCAEAVAPADDFQSTGIGLTSDELVDLYGEGEVGQSFIFYDFQGLDLYKDGCDLILSFPLDWADDEQKHEFALAESLLPADADYAGSFARHGDLVSATGESVTHCVTRRTLCPDGRKSERRDPDSVYLPTGGNRTGSDPAH